MMELGKDKVCKIRYEPVFPGCLFDYHIDWRCQFGHLFFMSRNGFKTRFAPSPSGYLHLGHVYAAWQARNLADEYGGKCLLRIEDIDLTRCRKEFVDAIYEDLEWLGFRFDGEVLIQSARIERYQKALDVLKERGVLYPCFCTRKTIEYELALLGSAPQGERIDSYPGACRLLTAEQREELIAGGKAHSWRLDCRRAFDLTGALVWDDLRFGRQLCDPSTIGDIILERKDCPASYHVAVVVDDAGQGVTHVTRGEDLFPSTRIHRVLQELWNYEVPLWFHHPLVRDHAGKRLAKRDQSLSIREMRDSGMDAVDVRRLLQCKDMGLT